MASQLAPSHPNSQVFQNISIGAYAKVHVGNVYQSAHDLVDGHNEQDQISMLRKALYYSTIDDRRKHIAHNQLETFSPNSLNWVWDTCLAEWLSSRDPTFWICGKPGSGKSTIVNYVASNHQTKRLLKTTGDSWTIVQFYFDFRAGEGIANTSEGLLRSLIVQLIDKCSEFRDVMKKQTDFLTSPETSYTTEELERLLLENASVMKTRVCVFVDGLDEYSGSPLNLMRSLSSLRRCPKMKICFASRPENVLSRFLNNVPQIVMQDHNETAIRAYLESTLEDTLSTSEKSLVQNLLGRIVSNANGVILWARLVADELIIGASSGYSLSELEAILNEIPTKVEQIYVRVLSKLSQDARTQAAVILRLIVAHQEDGASELHDLTLGSLLVACVIIFQDERPELSKLLSTLSLDQFRSRLHAVLGGLVEVYRGNSWDMSTWKVQMVHKTLATHLRQSRWTDEVLGQNFLEAYSSDLWFKLSVRALQWPAGSAEPSGVDILQSFTTLMPVSGSPNLIFTSDISFGNDAYDAKFAKHLTRFISTCVIHIPDLGSRFLLTRSDLLTQALSAPLMALHGPLTPTKTSFIRAKRCNCETLLNWTPESHLCKYPHLIYAIGHNHFSIFETEYLRCKASLSHHDKACLVHAAATCLLHPRSTYNAAEADSAAKNVGNIIDMLLADTEVKVKHLTIFLHEDVSKQTPLYVQRLLAELEPGPIVLTECFCESWGNAKHVSLLDCWAKSPVLDVEGLLLRLDVLMKLGQSPHDPCGGQRTVFHDILPRFGVDTTQNGERKLLALLQAGIDLPPDFINRKILKSLESICAQMKEQIEDEEVRDDYGTGGYVVSAMKKSLKPFEDFIRVLKGHLDGILRPNFEAEVTGLRS